MLVALSCNRRVNRWLGATVTNMPAGQEQGLNIGLHCDRPVSLGKLLQKNCLFFRHVCWSCETESYMRNGKYVCRPFVNEYGAIRSDMHTGWVQLEQTCLLIQCNSTQHSRLLNAIVTYTIAGALLLTHMTADSMSR